MQRPDRSPVTSLLDEARVSHLAGATADEARTLEAPVPTRSCKRSHKHEPQVRAITPSLSDSRQTETRVDSASRRCLTSSFSTTMANPLCHSKNDSAPRTTTNGRAGQHGSTTRKEAVYIGAGSRRLSLERSVEERATAIESTSAAWGWGPKSSGSGWGRDAIPSVRTTYWVSHPGS
jgi:hypothetical protein